MCDFSAVQHVCANVSCGFLGGGPAASCFHPSRVIIRRIKPRIVDIQDEK